MLAHHHPLQPQHRQKCVQYNVHPQYGMGRGGPSRNSDLGIRFVAVGRIVDRVIVASHAHHSGGDAVAQRYFAVAVRVLNSANTVEKYPRLTVTDRDAGTVHYDTNQNCIFLLVTAPDYPQRVAFKCAPNLSHLWRLTCSKSTSSPVHTHSSLGTGA